MKSNFKNVKSYFKKLNPLINMVVDEMFKKN